MKRKLLSIQYVFYLLLLTSCSQLMADEDAAFQYREIYLPENSTTEAHDLGLNSVDRDWGIWGHHLGAVLPKNASHSVYAIVNGQTDERQFCFSSDKLFDYIVNYIDDNFGSKDCYRFAILPNDNELACQCEQCRAKGCTKTDVSPAVLDMITRLAEEFPNHIFFTSYYLTTRKIPQNPMPQNAGVLISAIDFKLAPNSTPSETAFLEILGRWSAVTSNVYIWDYINNFDDYLTPFPIISVMQHRFRLYSQCKVKGIFLNGSGNDYSTFSRLHTHVLAALMQNPMRDWRELIQEKCKELYPVTGETIARFVLQQEDSLIAHGNALPMYEGVAKTRNVYLFEKDFVTFHDELQRLLPQTQGDEQRDVSLLCRALMLTRLELKRLHADTKGAMPMVEKLASVVKDGIRIYSESFWTIDSYVQDYTTMCNEAKNSHKNKLRGKEIKAFTALDEEYSDLSILTDGVTGLPGNYHCGQLISSADPALKLAIPYVPGMRRLRVGCTYNLQFHIALPQSVSIQVGNQVIEGNINSANQGVFGRTYVDFDLPSQYTGTILITIKRNKETRTMAIDEIEGF